MSAASERLPVQSPRPRPPPPGRDAVESPRRTDSCRIRSPTPLRELGAQALGRASEQAVLAAGVDGGADGLDGGDESTVPRLPVGPCRRRARRRVSRILGACRVGRVIRTARAVIRPGPEAVAPDTRIQVDGGPDPLPGAVRGPLLARRRVPVVAQGLDERVGDRVRAQAAQPLIGAPARPPGMEAQDVEEPGVQVRQAGLRERRRIGALRQAAELEPVQVEREGVEPVEPWSRFAVDRRPSRTVLNPSSMRSLEEDALNCSSSCCWGVRSVATTSCVTTS